MNMPAGSFQYHRAQWYPTAIIRGRDIVHPSGSPLQTCTPPVFGSFRGPFLFRRQWEQYQLFTSTLCDNRRFGT